MEGSSAEVSSPSCRGRGKAETLITRMFNNVIQVETWELASKKITGVRLDRELDRDVEEVVKEESVDKSTALRMLVGEGYRGWKLKKAMRKLREGEVSVWQASKISGMALLDFLALLKKEEGIEWAEFDTSETLNGQP